jgi:putative pyruvate formate lyase activating enzyme
MKFQAAYLNLNEKGELDKRIEELTRILESCELCPRKCRINRLKGEKGYCRSGRDLLVSSYSPHFGEERPLVGFNGSGTIFLGGCNLLCLYCQNYETSHLMEGAVIGEGKFAELMLDLQDRGCHNINFVTPTHFSPQIVKSIKIASEKGLRLPIVWNCGGYENVEVIKLLNGIVDIYMPDIKYGNNESAKKYSNVPDYFERCKEAVKEMHGQVGDLICDEDGIGLRGLLVRHLVLPEDLSGSEEVLKFLRGLSRDTYLNIMDQYRPEGRAYECKELGRHITGEEFNKAVEIAKRLGLLRLDKERFKWGIF